MHNLTALLQKANSITSFHIKPLLKSDSYFSGWYVPFIIAGAPGDNRVGDLPAEDRHFLAGDVNLQCRALFLFGSFVVISLFCCYI